MKINTNFLQLHQKDGVTRVTDIVRTATDAVVTPVTPEKKMVLQIGTAADEVVTPVTPVTRKKHNTVENFTMGSLEKTTKLQPSGVAQNTPAMPEYASAETNTAQATPAQQPENDAERLAAWERGELVTIPQTAEALEIYRALELENMARQIGGQDVAEELSRALATIDQINRQQRPDDFDFALSVLRSVTEDAAALLPARAKRAAA